MATDKHKRDFGSFHVSNVQELINLPEEEYVAPSVPFELPSFNQYVENNSFPFGRKAKKAHFYLEDECVFLNHGAFGGVLKEAMGVAQQWQRYIEGQPLRFYDRELMPHLVHVTRTMAKFVGCNARDLVLVPNVTTAVNCVLRSQKLQPNDTVFCLSVEYGAVKKILGQVCEESGAKVQEEFLSLPLSSKQQILDVVETRLKPGTRLAVFDHIPSNTPFIMPVQDLVKICHKKGVAVLIDGAHALGMLSLDLGDLGADYYLSNAHKWFSAPKGSAFMYVDPQHQHSTRPLVISHGFGSGFNSEFIWSGLRDYSAFLSLPSVVTFWQMIGVAASRHYMHSLLTQAATLLMEKWESSLLAPLDMCGSMAGIRLPLDLYKHCSPLTYDHAELTQNVLYDKYNIEVPIKCVQRHLYVRISCHIYNELSEYEHLAQAVIEITNEKILQNK